MNKKHQLIYDIQSSSLKTGEEFTLASGQKSNVYVDLKKTFLSFNSIKLISQLLFDKLMEFPRCDAVAGVVLGGCHLASILAMYADDQNYPLDVIFVRKETKDHGSKNLIECPSKSGRNVILLEDVVTTGGSVIKAAEVIEQFGFTVMGILAIVDRRPNKTNRLKNWEFKSILNFEELID